MGASPQNFTSKGMRVLFVILAFLVALFSNNTEKQKIDMHGGKSYNYGSFSQKMDANFTILRDINKTYKIE